METATSPPKRVVGGLFSPPCPLQAAADLVRRAHEARERGAREHARSRKGEAEVEEEKPSPCDCSSLSLLLRRREAEEREKEKERALSLSLCSRGACSGSAAASTFGPGAPKERNESEKDSRAQRKRQQSKAGERRVDELKNGNVKKQKTASLAAPFCTHLGREEFCAGCEVCAQLEEGDACSETDTREEVTSPNTEKGHERV